MNSVTPIRIEEKGHEPLHHRVAGVLPSTLRVEFLPTERPWRHSHAERGRDEKGRMRNGRIESGVAMRRNTKRIAPHD